MPMLFCFDCVLFVLCLLWRCFRVRGTMADPYPTRVEEDQRQKNGSHIMEPKAVASHPEATTKSRRSHATPNFSQLLAPIHTELYSFHFSLSGRK